jgi:hypothetical protein
METKRLIAGTEIVISAVLFIFIAYAIYLRYLVDTDTYLNFVREDGIVEYTTVLFLFLSSLICLYRTIQYLKIKKFLWVLTWAFLAALFFFAAGDEISWGQRIFGIESSDFFQQHNKQAETNLHNLVVGGQSINKLIFSQFLFAVLIIYFLFSRLMVRKIPFIRNLVSKFRVPLPKNYHIIIMLAAALMVLTIQYTKDSELNELSFAIVFFLIFLDHEGLIKDTHARS